MNFTSAIRVIGLLILLYLFRQVDWVTLKETGESIDPRFLLGTWVLLFPHLFIKVLRWRYLLSLQGCPLDLFQAHKLYLSALFLGVVTPGRSGEFAKVFFLKKSGVTGLGHGLTSVLVDRLFDLYALIVVALVGLRWLFCEEEMGIFSWVGLCGVSIAPFICCACRSRITVWMNSARWLIGKKGVDEEEGASEAGFARGLQQLCTWRLVGAAAYTAMAYLIFFGQCVLLARGSGILLETPRIIAAMAISSLASLLPVSILGLGTRELTLLHLLEPFGIGLEQVMVYAAGEILVFYLGTALIGFAAWGIGSFSGAERKGISLAKTRNEHMEIGRD